MTRTECSVEQSGLSSESSQSSETLIIETELAKLYEPEKEPTGTGVSSTPACASGHKFAEFRIVLVLSGVSHEDRQMVAKIVKRENGIVIASFSEHCTHVVTKAEPAKVIGERSCGRTLKVFQGLNF